MVEGSGGANVLPAERVCARGSLAGRVTGSHGSRPRCLLAGPPWEGCEPGSFREGEGATPGNGLTRPTCRLPSTQDPGGPTSGKRLHFIELRRGHVAGIGGKERAV